MYDVHEIKEKIDLVGLISETVQLKRAGVNYLGMCPFHANSHSPALAVFPSTKTWHCFGSCGDGGDVLAWWMKRENCDFDAAVKALGEKAGMSQGPLSPGPFPPRMGERGEAPAPLAAPLAEGPGQDWVGRADEFVGYAEKCLWGDGGSQALAYLRNERGLWDETIRDFRLGYNPTNVFDSCARWGMNDGKKVWLPRGIVIPGLWRGKAQYVKVRRPRPDDSLARYIGPLVMDECITDHGRLNPNDDPKFGGPRGGHAAVLFAARGMLRHTAPVLLLTEGEWDAMLAWQWGQDLCHVGTMGGAAARADASRLAHLARYAAIGVVMDSDAAGQESVQKYWARVAEETGRVHVVAPPDHDLTDYQMHTGNLRGWMAGVVADLLDGLIDGLDGGAPEQWGRVRDWARSEQFATVG